MNTLNQTLKGRYKVGIVNDKTGEEAWLQEGSNLILNNGMDEVRSRAVVNLMTYAICGTGTRNNSFASGLSAITQSGANVYLQNTSGFIPDFTSSVFGYGARAEIGDVIQYQNNSQSMIVSVLDGFNLTVTPNYTFTTPQTFNLWKTSQTTLMTEISRSNSYVGGASYCGTTYSTNYATHRRTYDFPVLNWVPISFNEIGVGWSATVYAPTVFSRILLDPTINVPVGFRLRVMYDLQTMWAPTGSSYITASVGGWPVAPSTNTYGTQSVQQFLVSEVTVANGNSDTSHAFLDPYYINDGNPLYCWVSPVSESLAAFGTYVNRSAGASNVQPGSPAAYVNGTYIYDKTWTFPISTGNGPMGSMGLGGGSAYTPSGNGQVYAIVFNQSQSKNTMQTLALTFRWSWGRDLS